MSEQNPDSKQKYISVPCNACGSEMIYDPKSQGLSCNHCGNKQDLPKDADMVIERSFSEGLDLNSLPTGFEVETKVFHCNNCGSNTAVDPDKISFECPFCASTNVNESAFDKRMIRPSGVLPFKITKEQALDNFTTWIGKGKLFRPAKLSKKSVLDKIHGIYLPFWTYDAETASSWTAESGTYYYETEYYSDAEGNEQSRQVRKTEWEYVDGYHQESFDDVLVLASHGLKQNEIERIYPFDLGAVVNYDSRFILGLESEVYQKDIEEGYAVADAKMDSDLRSSIKQKIPGDTHRNLEVNTRKSAVTFKHLLLPIWIAAYVFNGKVYKFMVNGESGKISGKKPKSWSKILIAIGLAAGIIGGLIWWFSR